MCFLRTWTECLKRSIVLAFRWSVNVFCSEFVIILDNAESRKEEGEDRWTQAIANCYAFHENVKKNHIFICNTHIFFLYKKLFFKRNIYFLHEFLSVKTLYMYKVFSFVWKDFAQNIYFSEKDKYFNFLFEKKLFQFVFATS